MRARTVVPFVVYFLVGAMPVAIAEMADLSFAVTLMLAVFIGLIAGAGLLFWRRRIFEKDATPSRDSPKSGGTQVDDLPDSGR